MNKYLLIILSIFAISLFGCKGGSGGGDSTDSTPGEETPGGGGDGNGGGDSSKSCRVFASSYTGDSSGNTTACSFDESNAELVCVNNDLADPATTYFRYDSVKDYVEEGYLVGLSNKTHVDIFKQSGSSQITEYVYNSEGNLVGTMTDNFNSSDTLTSEVDYTYSNHDAKGRPLSYTFSSGSCTTTGSKTYDDTNLIVSDDTSTDCSGSINTTETDSYYNSDLIFTNSVSVYNGGSPSNSSVTINSTDEVCY